MAEGPREEIRTQGNRDLTLGRGGKGRNLEGINQEKERNRTQFLTAAARTG